MQQVLAFETDLLELRMGNFGQALAPGLVLMLLAGLVALLRVGAAFDQEAYDVAIGNADLGGLQQELR